jgi:aspartyl-tRNA synthetase
LIVAGKKSLSRPRSARLRVEIAKRENLIDRKTYNRCW